MEHRYVFRALSQLIIVFLQMSVVLGFGNALYAQDRTDVEKMAPVVVTATALPTPQSQTPGSVTVITKEEIEIQKPNNVGTVLYQVPGLFVDEMGGRGGVSSIYMRGGDPNFTVIMLDGIPINDSMNQRGGSVDLSTLTPEGIERIEVVRGPTSALYGSDAMSGVINILSKPSTSKTSSRIQIEAGDYGYARGLFNKTGTVGNVSYAGSGSMTRNDEMVEGDKFELGTVNGNATWHKEDSPFSAQMFGRYTNTQVRSFPEGSGGPRLAILRDSEQRETDQLVFGSQLTHHITTQWDHKLSANLFYQSQDIDNPGVLSAPGMLQIPPARFTTEYTKLLLLSKHGFQLSRVWTVAGGLQIIDEHGESSGLQESTALGLPQDRPIDFQKTRLTPGGYLELMLIPHSFASFTFGTRLDFPEETEMQINPRISGKIQFPTRTIVHVSYGEGFKLPSFNALGDPVIGNPNLTPETSIGWDVGIRQGFLGGRHEIEFTYFYNTFSNLIDLDPNLARQGIFRLANLTKVTTQGIELSLLANPTSTLHLKGYFTYVNSTPEGSSDQLRNRPRAFGGLIVETWPLPNLMVRGKLQAVGERKDIQIPTTEDTVGGYIRADITATLTFKKFWKLFGVINNISNSQYEQFLGFPAPGMFFRFGLQYSK